MLNEISMDTVEEDRMQCSKVVGYTSEKLG